MEAFSYKAVHKCRIIYINEDVALPKIPFSLDFVLTKVHIQYESLHACRIPDINYIRTSNLRPKLALVRVLWRFFLPPPSTKPI